MFHSTTEHSFADDDLIQPFWGRSIKWSKNSPSTNGVGKSGQLRAKNET